MNTRTRMVEKQGFIVQRSSIHKRFCELHSKFVIASFRDSVFTEDFTYQEFDEYLSIQKALSAENSIREKDKNAIKNIAKIFVENNLNFIHRILSIKYFKLIHMNLIFNSKYSLFTELKNICNKYGAGGIVACIKINENTAKIVVVESNKNKNIDKIIGVCIYFNQQRLSTGKFGELILDRIELVHPILTLAEEYRYASK